MADDPAQDRPRIDYVSPLPPVRSGIADYSVDLLPGLAQRLDLRVIRLPEQPVAAEIAERWSPVAAEHTGEDGRLPLYQMGNNPYHQEVWRLAVERPGVVTLHDLVLHHLHAHQTLGERDFSSYREGLIADHGWVGEVASHPRKWGDEGDAALFALPAHRRLLRRQRGVVVHSRWAAERIAEEAPEVAVEAVPMGIPLPAAADRAAGGALRRRLRVPAEAPLLGSFGFQTPIKRTLAAVEALADERLRGAHLLIVGELSPALDFEAAARRAGVADRVHVTGFVPYEDFLAAIGAVELCLNLRYPTAGETSASLLRVLAMGRPAVVSDHAQFAELPDEVALKVPLSGGALGEGEGTALAAAAADLLAAPERLAAMGAAAREHVRRQHDPAAAAAAVAAALERLSGLDPPATGEDEAAARSRLFTTTPAAESPDDDPFWQPPGEERRRSLALDEAPPRLPLPTSLSWRRLPAAIEVDGHRGWAPGERRRLTVDLTNRGHAVWLASEAGPGGVALEVRMATTDDGAASLRQPPWLGLQRSLAPGERARFEIDLRRPLGTARLIVAPRVLGAPEAELDSWREDV